MTSCLCCRPAIVAKSIHNEGFASPSRALNRVAGLYLTVETGGPSVQGFVACALQLWTRMRALLISSIAWKKPG
ncbi:protein EMBRYO SAC DEVELOPMENT ARREST 3 chloroplastic [Prunus yedoensis var. nudiflora]|uniref:Protein EMBRYO SAC DEVELOPMENT ARREST 3 chloroplastic n=1 Tax=Prunus yedoensis var. nudiflora TaxID=2094558 RepID=A0A314ZRK5_PRUYE|nr:protein EMBRYO SAC DEVELOPMENT ARREST 3 chloroplastic [Prunus yedoensis var. nudiflora]